MSFNVSGCEIRTMGYADYGEVVTTNEYRVNLSRYAEPGTKFFILQGGPKNEAFKCATITF